MEYNDILAQYTNSTCLGLFTGHTGVLLLSSLTSSDKEHILEQINYLSSHIYEVSSLTFSDGLLGIGWTLEFLIQDQIIDSSYDNILENIDDIIYQWITFYKVNSFSIDKGYLGCFLYLYYRLRGNRSKLPYKELALKECTIFVIDKIYKEVLKQEKSVLTEWEWMQVHIISGKFRELNIQNHIINDLLLLTQQRLKKRKYNEANTNFSTELHSALYNIIKKNKGTYALSNLFVWK